MTDGADPPAAPALPAMPARDPRGHKGTFGTVAVIGGCARAESRMVGAPALTAMSALRAGAGLARVLAPAPIIDAVLTIAPSATGIALETNEQDDVVPHLAAEAVDALVPLADCLAIGPGLGRGDGPRALTLRAIQQISKPVVADADAINAMAETPEIVRDLHAQLVITPHPGEFRRLCDGMGLNDALGLASDNDASRAPAAEALAQRLGAIVVLKGAGTVVSDGAQTWTCERGHHCLATAGTGDVLTGLLAGLIAQFVAPAPEFAMPGVSPEMAAKLAASLAGGASQATKPLSLFEAAMLGVEIHARAGEAWADTHGAAGLLASDLADAVPDVIAGMRV